MERDEIVEALNLNLEKEYASVLLYMQFAGDPRLSREPAISTIMSRLAEDEVKHADRLADTIKGIGGKVSWRVTPFERKKTLRESLERIVQLEAEAIEEYASLMERLTDKPTIRSTLLPMLEDERAHKAQTERLLHENLALLDKA